MYRWPIIFDAAPWAQAPSGRAHQDHVDLVADDHVEPRLLEVERLTYGLVVWPHSRGLQCPYKGPCLGATRRPLVINRPPEVVLVDFGERSVRVPPGESHGRSECVGDRAWVCAVVGCDVNLHRTAHRVVASDESIRGRCDVAPEDEAHALACMARVVGVAAKAGAHGWRRGWWLRGSGR